MPKQTGPMKPQSGSATTNVLAGPGIARRLWVKARRISESFWFVPGLCVLAAALIAHGALALDRWPPAIYALRHLGWISDVGVDGARSMLSTIGTAMFGVAATAFSITISVITTAASNYGPRLVRNFMTDRGNQIVLGVLCSTFIYTLLVVKTIRSASDNEPAWVPQFSVSLGILFALVDVALLIWFIHHISDSVQITTIAQDVRERWMETVRRWFPSPQSRDLGTRAAYPPPSEATDGLPGRFTLERVGYIVEVDFDRLADLAGELDARIVMIKRVGDHVVEAEPVALVWPASALEEFTAAARRQFTIDDARTTYQDLRFAEQQQVELAVRALSSGTNDPYTAINAIDEVAAGITIAVSRPEPGDVVLRDGAARLWIINFPLTELIAMPFDQIRLNLGASTITARALVDLARRIQAANVHPQLHIFVETKLRQLLAYVHDSGAKAGMDQTDIESLAEYVRTTAARAARTWDYPEAD